MSPAEVLCVHSDQDDESREELHACLRDLERAGRIRFASRRIADDPTWSAGVDEPTTHADVVLLVVSPPFLDSDYCYGSELLRVLERHERGETTVIPVLVDPADWKGTSFGGLSALPCDGRAVADWPRRDAAWADVADGVRGVVDALDGTTTEVPPCCVLRVPVQFAHVGTVEWARPAWDELPHGPECHVFGRGCDTYVNLREFITDGELYLDVEILNVSKSSMVLSRVGVDVIDVVHHMHVYGIPQPGRIEPPSDVYPIDMPDLKREYSMDRGWHRVDRPLPARFDGPITVRPQSRYHYGLWLQQYQRRVHNNARLRLTAEVGGETIRSHVLHVFTW